MRNRAVAVAFSNRGLNRLLCLIALSAICVSGIRAQESAISAIAGQVVDSSKSAVPNATVRVINAGTNAERLATTDQQGEFSVPNLPPARYQIRVEKEGFQTSVVGPFDLLVGQAARQLVTLTVGAVTQTVTVTTETPLLQTENATISEVITQKQIEELPLNGRSVIQLASLTGGAAPVNLMQRGTGLQYGQRIEYVQIDGGRDSSTNYVMDGVYVRSMRFNNLALQPSVDTLQEFNVLSNAFSTEYGQGQAVVSMVTKSGTNQLHGTLFEFVRNNAFDTRNLFATVQRFPTMPAYRRNQFGGTAGGPVIKDRVFVFGGYEGLRTVQGQIQNDTVPNPAELAGNFSALPSNEWPIVPTTLSTATTPLPPGVIPGQPFPGGIIPASMFSTLANVLTPTFPTPNNPSAGPLAWTGPAKFVDNWDEVTFRADEVLSQKHSLFERYIWYNAAQQVPLITANPNAISSYPQSDQNVSVGDTYLVSSKIVNDFHVGYNRAYALIDPVDYQGKNWTQLAGLQNLAGSSLPIDFGRPAITIGGFSVEGEGGITQGARENIYSIADTLSDVIGKHTFRFGVQFQDRRFWQITEVPPRGAFTFNGTSTAPTGVTFSSLPVAQQQGDQVADYLLGRCSTCGGAAGYSGSNYADHTYGVFINDQWQVTPKLTFNWGVRWEYISPFTEALNQAGNFDPSVKDNAGNLGAIAFSVVPPLCSATLLTSCIPASELPLIDNNSGVYPASIVKPNKTNFGPRLGLAYQITDKMVVRSGFGFFYDNYDLNELQFTRLVPPFYSNYTLNKQCVASAYCASPLFPTISQFTSFPAPFAVNPNNRTPYAEEWNLGFQYSLGHNTVVELSYTGNESHREHKRYNQNESTVFGPQNVAGCSFSNPTCPFPQLQQGILTTSNVANGAYNALNLKVEKHYSAGFFFLGNFQWSKAIDDGSGEVDANDTAFSTNFNLDRGLSSYDQRYRSSISAGYELPFGKGKSMLSSGGVAAAIFGNWQIQGIVSLYSGFHFSPTSSNVCSCGSFVPQRADRTAAWSNNGQVSNPTVHEYFNPASFAAPAIGTQGDAGRDVILGPPVKDVDFSVSKNINMIGERLKAQFRAESFDLFNHPILGPPILNVSASNAGAITVANNGGDGRDIQFGLKLIW